MVEALTHCEHLNNVTILSLRCSDKLIDALYQLMQLRTVTLRRTTITTNFSD